MEEGKTNMGKALDEMVTGIDKKLESATGDQKTVLEKQKKGIQKIKYQDIKPQEQ